MIIKFIREKKIDVEVYIVHVLFPRSLSHLCVDAFFQGKIETVWFFDLNMIFRFFNSDFCWVCCTESTVWIRTTNHKWAVPDQTRRVHQRTFYIPNKDILATPLKYLVIVCNFLINLNVYIYLCSCWNITWHFENLIKICRP